MNRLAQAIRLFPAISGKPFPNRMCAMTFFTKKTPTPPSLSDKKPKAGQSPCGANPPKVQSRCKEPTKAQSPCDTKPTKAQSPCDSKPRGINGFGRIGKCLPWLPIKKNIKVVAINQPFVNSRAIAHSFSQDTVHGLFPTTVRPYDHFICIGSDPIRVFHEEKSENIKWSDVPVDYVIESTGRFLSVEAASDAAKTVGVKSPIARAFASSESNDDKISNLPVDRITCTLIPGDGVYPELMNSVQTVLKAIGAPIDFETILFSDVQHSSSAKVEDVIKSINRNRICLMGALMSPDVSYSGELQNLHMKLRKGLDLYSNVVHVVSWPDVASRHKNIDIVIIRERTEGEHSALEHEPVDGVVESLKIVTASKSLRIAKFAFDYAIRNNRQCVTCVHKANIMKLADGLFLKSCQEIKQLYPGVNFEAMMIDNCTMQMVSNPQQFDILVMPNLYGNILDNLAAGLVGGAGVVASSSFSPECAVFEPGASHVFQTAVGKNIANPTAMLMCASKMLRHVNLQQYSESIRNAIREVLAAGKVRTRDLGGSSSTHEFTDAVIKAIV